MTVHQRLDYQVIVPSVDLGDKADEFIATLAEEDLVAFREGLATSYHGILNAVVRCQSDCVSIEDMRILYKVRQERFALKIHNYIVHVTLCKVTLSLTLHDVRLYQECPHMSVSIPKP